MVGSILIVIGLYSVLWGKHKEQAESKVEDDIPLPIKGGNAVSVIEVTDNFTEPKYDQRGEDNNNMLSSVAISIPTRDPTNVNQEARI